MDPKILADALAVAAPLITAIAEAIARGKGPEDALAEAAKNIVERASVIDADVDAVAR